LDEAGPNLSYNKNTGDAVMAKIIRIQDKDGKGPYRKGTVYELDIPFNPRHQPSPSDEPELAGWYKLDDKESRSCKFGFKDEMQMRRWFSDEDREKLEKAGYKAVELEVEIMFESKTQVIYRELACSPNSQEDKEPASQCSQEVA
jgi:hypothetical protein